VWNSNSSMWESGYHENTSKCLLLVGIFVELNLKSHPRPELLKRFMNYRFSYL